MEDVKLTKEQSDIVDFIDALLSDNSKYKAIGIKAFAGCGKSFVLKYIATKLKNKKILGLAFNNSIVKENAHSFPKRNSKWFTVHTLAKEYLIKNGVEFDFKNSTKNFKDIEVLKILKLNEDNITLGKVINEVFKVYCQSDLKELSIINIKKGIEEQINEYLLNTDDKYLELGCKYSLELWDKFVNLELPPTFDFYLKYFEVNEFAKNIKEFDLVQLDEAQDSNAVTMSIITQIPAKYIYVGDEHQSIYAFRGTKNALNYTDKLFYLSTTFRYIPKIAQFANTILKSYKNEKVPITSLANEKTSKKDNKTAYLSRNNATMIGLIAELIKLNKEFVTVKDPKEIFETSIALYEFIQNGIITDSKYEFLLNIKELKEDNTNNEPKTIFDIKKRTNKIKKYIFDSEDNELSTAFKMQQRYKKGLHLFLNIATNYYKKNSNTNIVLSTAHTSKGLEWDNVVLLNDFPDIKNLIINAKIKNVKELLELANKNNLIASQIVQEINLYYVAVTRARYSVKIKKLSEEEDE